MIFGVRGAERCGSKYIGTMRVLYGCLVVLFRSGLPFLIFRIPFPCGVDLFLKTVPIACEYIWLHFA